MAAYAQTGGDGEDAIKVSRLFAFIPELPGGKGGKGAVLEKAVDVDLIAARTGAGFMSAEEVSFN
jgi:hypothetical protein